MGAYKAPIDSAQYKAWLRFEKKWNKKNEI
jgi:hypothetical protein